MCKSSVYLKTQLRGRHTHTHTHTYTVEQRVPRSAMLFLYISSNFLVLFSSARIRQRNALTGSKSPFHSPKLSFSCRFIIPFYSLQHAFQPLTYTEFHVLLSSVFMHARYVSEELLVRSEHGNKRFLLLSFEYVAADPVGRAV